MNPGAPAHPVFLLTHEFYPKRGGIATFAEEMARAAAGLGHEVEVWAQAAPGVAEKAWPFHVRRLPIRGSHGFACVGQIAREFVARRRQLRHATVYLAEPGPMLAMMLLQSFPTFRPRRLLLTFHGSEILRFHHNPAVRLLTRGLIRHASRISTLTNFTQDLLGTRFPEAASKTFLTPGALRSDFIIRRAAPAAPKEKLVVLTVGRLHPRKGQLLTLQALQALPPAQRARLEYWIAGGSGRAHYEQTLRDAASRSDLAVKFLGNLPDDRLAAVYDQADIFAMTSIDHGHSVEGFGLVYLEASAHGLPVIAHRVGGVPEAVEDNVTGLLVPPHTPTQLTAAFARLIAEPELRRRLGGAGRTWATRNSWARSAELLFGPPPAPAITPSKP